MGSRFPRCCARIRRAAPGIRVVYGHRRVQACLALQRPVRAVVKALTDAQLVVAQGQENSARKDLSYIERALFAMRLSDRGFDREVIMAALGLSKSHLSTLLSVGRRIPVPLIEAIGPAPKAGEPRWSALAERLEQDAAGVAARVVATQRFGRPQRRTLYRPVRRAAVRARDGGPAKLGRRGTQDRHLPGKRPQRVADRRSEGGAGLRTLRLRAASRALSGVSGRGGGSEKNASGD